MMLLRADNTGIGENAKAIEIGVQQRSINRRGNEGDERIHAANHMEEAFGGKHPALQNHVYCIVLQRVVHKRGQEGKRIVA